MRYEPASIRFERKYIPEPNSGCWIWTESCDEKGYGRFNDEGNRLVKAHRFAYRKYKGEIPVGLHVLHKCDTRCCVNPDHLSVGTHKENMAQMSARGRCGKIPKEKMPRGEGHCHAKLDSQTVLIIRHLLKAGIAKADIAAHFNIPRSLCQSAVDEWSHVAYPPGWETRPRRVIKSINDLKHTLGIILQGGTFK